MGHAQRIGIESSNRRKRISATPALLAKAGRAVAVNALVVFTKARDRVSGSEGRACRSFDCRSRRAARGQSARGREERPMRLGSSRSLPIKELAGERASEAGPRAAQPWHRWRARVEVRRRESGGGRSEHSSMEGASGRSTSKPLTGLRWRRSSPIEFRESEFRLVRELCFGEAHGVV
jgi:hypothetical protein